MKKSLLKKLLELSIVPLALCTLLVPFSLFVGWNLFTLIIFWLVLTPVIAIGAPVIVTNNRHSFFPSAIGLTLFYLLMVFMIYDHYQSDYFQLMMISFIVNLIFISLYSLIRQPDAHKSFER
jgi:hypothetical protein